MDLWHSLVMLCAKLPPNLPALNNRRFCYTSWFPEWEIWAGLSRAVVLFWVALAEAAWWYSAGSWVGLEGGRQLHSWVLSRDGRKAGPSQDCRLCQLLTLRHGCSGPNAKHPVALETKQRHFLALASDAVTGQPESGQVQTGAPLRGVRTEEVWGIFNPPRDIREIFSAGLSGMLGNSYTFPRLNSSVTPPRAAVWNLFHFFLLTLQPSTSGLGDIFIPTSLIKYESLGINSVMWEKAWVLEPKNSSSKVSVYHPWDLEQVTQSLWSSVALSVERG